MKKEKHYMEKSNFVQNDLKRAYFDYIWLSLMKSKDLLVDIGIYYIKGEFWRFEKGQTYMEKRDSVQND